MKIFLVLVALTFFTNFALADSIDAAIETTVVNNPTYQNFPFLSGTENSICSLLGYTSAVSATSSFVASPTGSFWAGDALEGLIKVEASNDGNTSNVITQITCARPKK